MSKSGHGTKWTAEELKSLDEQDDNSVNSVRELPDRDTNADRYLATLSILLSCALVNLLANGTGAIGTLGRPLMVPVSCFMFEWYRIYGSLTLTRTLRAVLNMASVLKTYQEFDPTYSKLYSADFCCQLPQLNTDLPRTADEKS
ncbi:unnamed protein product [Bursaphelenchus okinawaensis]|uniref:Uncharacterized protein n=1 Tax=Bursaphelenchus okinawaensis TaxID=465554 RepID=A0A811LI04_9BILA|nr:unnamed protein product [Bursaphelenchus okinawaensis]CAG9126006.1 unnamed protein product [Bursaphelenchus okinawaensis]